MEKKIKTREKSDKSRNFLVSPFLISPIFSNARNRETEKPTNQPAPTTTQWSSLQIKNY
jgi:hypothetical protein